MTDSDDRSGSSNIEETFKIAVVLAGQSNTFSTSAEQSSFNQIQATGSGSVIYHSIFSILHLYVIFYVYLC